MQQLDRCRTVSSPEFDVPVPKPIWSLELGVVPVNVPVPVPVRPHELVVGVVPDVSHELGVVVVPD